MNPTLAAHSFAAAVATGQATGPEIAGCMKRYRASFADDRTHFMVQAVAWLEGSSFLVFLDDERQGKPIRQDLGKARGEALTAKGSGLEDYGCPTTFHRPCAAAGGF